MYCVKCGRKGIKGEKRCRECSTRLVTPKQLNSLLKLKKQMKRTKSHKMRKALECTGEFIRGFWKKLCLAALILWQTIRNLCTGLYKAARNSFSGKKRRHMSTHSVPTKGAGTSKRQSVSKQSRIIAYTRSRDNAAVARRSTETVNRADKSKRVSAGSSPAQDMKNKSRNTESAKNALKRKKHPTHKTKRLTDELFSLKHIRSTVAVILLLFTVITIALWGTLTDSGQRSFAKLGVGSWKGYILLGDEYMEAANYTRAVECYYSSIKKNMSLEGTYKLAAAYSFTGDISREANALMACIMNYPDYKMAYVQLYRLFPYEETRPSEVNSAINSGLSRFGSLE